MDRFTGSAAFTAALLSLTLTACGGGGGGTDTAPAPSGGGGPTTTVQGVSTPSSVSVVTAKNAQ
jgi:hypothetical protein